MIKEIIISVFSIQTFLLGFLLITKRTNRKQNVFLGLVLFSFGLTTINFSLYHILSFENLNEYIYYFRLELLYAIGPSLYLYTKSVLIPSNKFQKKELLIFIPTIFEFIYYRTHIYRLGITENENIFHQLYRDFFMIQQWIGFIYSSIFMVLSFLLLYKYKKWLYHNFSNINKEPLKWLFMPIIYFILF